MNIFQKKNDFSSVVERELQLTEKKRLAVVGLAVARTAAGEAIVEGDAEAELAQVVRRTAEIEALDRALALVREQRPAAVRADYSEQAKQLREQSSAKKRELSALQAKTGKLLQELGKLEGVPYTQDLLEAQAPEGGVIPNVPGLGWYTPKSATLREEIDAIERRATANEEKNIPTGGEYDVEGITDNSAVIRAVLMHPSQGPTAWGIQEWLDRCETDRRLEGRGFGSMPRRVRIIWNDGVIDNGQSYIYVPELAQPRLSNDGHQKVVGIDTATAQFHAHSKFTDAHAA